ncbi:UNVERIFIED_CONTAM: hypothetical protein PYX00_010587 [Menopon gallinae]|uniref:Uncharacterized protein n=1 Tax=Menopon gallinae TaxID=328185 RepID=A0AAW2HG69_9NEOP
MIQKWLENTYGREEVQMCRYPRRGRGITTGEGEPREKAVAAAAAVAREERHGGNDKPFAVLINHYQFGRSAAKHYRIFISSALAAVI